MGKSSAPEQDQEARAALKERALAYVDRIAQERDDAEFQRQLAVSMMETAQRERDQAVDERDAAEEKLKARQMDSSSLTSQLSVEVGRSVDMRRAAEEALKLIGPARNMTSVPTSSIAAAARLLDEGIKSWRASK
jgi:hypothetical protein